MVGSFRSMTQPFGYRYSLDGLRAIAMLAVLGFHSMVSHMRGGFLGVDVFFVISGFLITILLLGEQRDTGRIALGKFYCRRALRLFPALFVCLGFWLVYTALFASRQDLRHEILPVSFYYANWYTIWHGDGSLKMFGHAWSLSLEEQFYLIWPVILIVARQLRPKLFASLIITGIGIASLGRAWLWKNCMHYERTYYGFDTRADALLVG